MRGYPAPCESSSLPRLGLLQASVKQVRAKQDSTITRRHLQTTPHHLCQIWKSGMSAHQTWTPRCFGRQSQAVLFIFFHSGEITVPSAVAFNPAVHPAYGDVAVDNVQNPSVVHFHLKRSKCDQLGTKLMCSSVTVGLCPVTAVLTYITQCGDGPGAFFLLEGGRPLTKAYFIARVQAALRSAGVQFSDYTGHSCSWYPGFHNSDVQAMEQHCLP